MTAPQHGVLRDSAETDLHSTIAALRAERDAALAHQAALTEILDLINRSPGDPTPVFEAILRKAHDLIGAQLGCLFLYDGTNVKGAAVHGYPDEIEAVLRQVDPPTPAMRRILGGERFYHIHDRKASARRREAEKEDEVSSTNPIASVISNISEVRTNLIVPLRKDGAVLGFISANRTEVRPYTEAEIALLENFAGQAVIAMENARLLGELRQRTEDLQESLAYQTATAEVLQVINRSPGDLAPVFDAMLDKAMRLCGAAFGILWTYDGEWIHAVAIRGATAAYAQFLTSAPHRPGLDNAHGRLLRRERFVHIVDASADTAYRSYDPIRRATVELGGARTVLAVPLCKDEVFLGDFVIYRQEVRPFTDKQITLLESFAAQAVIAMENARLLGELRVRTDELAQRQAELRTTFENMGDGVAMFDETPRLVAWNRKFQEILDVPDGVLAERRTYEDYIRYLTERGEFGPKADPEAQIRRLQARIGQSTIFERTRPNGRVIEVRHNPVSGGGFVLIYADITERKRSEEEIRAARDAAEEASRTVEAAYRDLKAAQANLIQAEKMASLGQLTAGIAHEIKNPLNFVNNFASLSVELLAELKETAAPGFTALPEDRRADIEDVSGLLTSNLQKIVEHGKRADGIVKSMLEHSRGASGERRSVDLNTLVDEALNLAYHGARAQDQSFNVTLERDFGAGIAPVELAPQEMTRVFLNLFSNGFYATRKRAQNAAQPSFEPTLKVTTRDFGDAVEVRVRDNGTGIPADIKDKLFQPFFTTKPTGEGTGLGLSISYDIVTQQHGGTLSVESDAGAYTEFTVNLPRPR